MDASGGDVYVLPGSVAQRRYWLLDQLRPGDPSLNAPIAARLTGRLDVAALEASLNELVRRHESLRTAFETEDGELVQLITPALTISLPIADLRAVPEREAEAGRLTVEEARRPFDLSRGPLFRASLLRLADEEHLLLVTMHHAICDGWSLGLVFKEVGALYNAFSQNRPSPLAELPVQYADFACWQRQWLEGEDFGKQLGYWKKQLAGTLPTIELPIDRPRRAGRAAPGAIETLLLPTGLTDELKAWCHRRDVTMYMLFLAAFKILLRRYAGQEDILVGSPVANRNHVEVEDLIGLFSNMLVMRTDLSADPTYAEVLGRVRETALGAFANHELPFDMLVEKLQLDRGARSTPLPQVMFIFQKAFMQPAELRGLTLAPQRSVSPGAICELTQSVVERAEGLRLQLEYNTDLFDAGTINWMLGNFKSLLERIVANPEERISEFPLPAKPAVTPHAHADAPAAAPGAREEVLRELFESTPGQAAESVAAICGGEELTYGELSARAEELARRLRAGGVGAGVTVGLALERAPETLIALLGILKAGGTCLPFDSCATGEQERLAREIKEAGVRFFLASRRLAPVLPPNDTKVVIFDADRSGVRGEVERDERGASASGVGTACGGFVAPRDALERQLSEIWEGAFGIEPIGVRDNFFDLGGHSLLAVHLFEQIRKAVGKTIPLATLFEAPTIEELAGVLRRQAGQSLWSSLVPLQPGGTRPPFFCIHAWGGNVLFYRDLARRLGPDQPFYGLQAQGLDGKQPRHTRVEDMAAHYVREIRSLRPEGPYYLGGSSFGGTVAFEMARQLEAQGQEVGLLALFDTWGPGYPRRVREVSALRNRAQDLLQRVEHHWGSLRMLGPAERRAYFRQKAVKARNLLRRRRKQLLKRIYVAAGRTLPESLQRVQTNNSRALEEYVPAVYGGRITLFRATRQPAGIVPDPLLGWGEWAAGGVDVHVVEGAHGSIIAEPRVRVTVEILRSYFEQAGAGHAAR